MKSIIHKIASFALSIVILLSTMSFALNVHICGDMLVKANMFHSTEGCGMDMENPATESCSITDDNCCDEGQISIEGQDELQLSVNKISFEQQIFVASFIFTYFHINAWTENVSPSFEEYAPPLVVKPIFKLDETYLI